MNYTICPQCRSEDLAMWAADGESSEADQAECNACGWTHPATLRDWARGDKAMVMPNGKDCVRAPYEVTIIGRDQTGTLYVENVMGSGPQRDENRLKRIDVR